MNNDPPFNPLLPPDFGMNPQPGSAEPQGHAGTSAHRENSNGRKASRPRRARSANGGGKKNCWSRWDRIKGKLALKLASIDQERLKRVLLACGIAAGMVAAIVLAIKILPLALTILTLLGLALALQVWDRLRRFPQPPF